MTATKKKASKRAPLFYQRKDGLVYTVKGKKVLYACNGYGLNESKDYPTVAIFKKALKIPGLFAKGVKKQPYAHDDVLDMTREERGAAEPKATGGFC